MAAKFYPTCHEGAKCFAKKNKKCTILTSTTDYKTKHCPFCKAKQES